MAQYRDRYEARQSLVAALAFIKHLKNAIVLALPRGGVPVATMVVALKSIRQAKPASMIVAAPVAS